MRKAALALTVLSVCLGQTTAMARFCPTNLPNEIFCDDFDTYCEGGGYPEPTQPTCSLTDRDGGKIWVQSVWYQSSYGTTMTLEENTAGILDGITSGRFFGKIDLGQQTVRDWVSSPPVGEPDQKLDIQRFIGNVFGPEYAAVGGSDAKPLTFQFLTGANVGKLLYSSGYMELGFGDTDEPLNRANTDFATWPKNYCCGNPTIIRGPWPLICAQGNADPEIPESAGCPSVAVSPPPVHQAIAVGALSLMDTDPCHCERNDSRPKGTHLALFDGQLWWTLKKDSPVASTGTVTPKDGGPMVPPDIFGGDFALSSEGNKSYNAVKVTIKSTTIKVELTAWVKSTNGSTYVVTNIMDDIPRKYLGPFDRIRSGVGPGCELTGNQDWVGCKSFFGRNALWQPEGWFVDFDDVVLHGGYGYLVEGACCNAADGSCSMTLQSECAGRWTSSGQSCEETICCPQIYGDANGDGSADMIDFAALQLCMTVGGGTVTPSCRCLDYNGDNAIATPELQHFIDCANGPGLPGNISPECVGRGW